MNRHGFEEHEEGLGGEGGVDSLFNNPPPNKYKAVGAGYVTSKIRFPCV